MHRLNVALLIGLCLAGLPPVGGQAWATPQGREHPTMPDHHEGVNHRGDQVMGFSREKTTDHFRLYPDGGAIESRQTTHTTRPAVIRFACTSSISPGCSRPAILTPPW